MRQKVPTLSSEDVRKKGHELVTPAGMARLLKVKVFYGDTKSVFNILSTAKGKCVQQENDIVLHIVSVFKGDF